MNDRLLNLWNDPRRTPLIIGLVAFNAGAALGYFLGLKKNPPVYNVTETVNLDFDVDNLARNLGDVENQLKERKKESLPEYASNPSRLLDDAQKFVNERVKDKLDTGREIVQLSPDPVEDGETLVRRSVFATGEGWDYELEVKKRTTTEPHIIHRDEFFNEENDYTQSTLTFYAGDDILVDEDDKPIYNHEQITGQLRFGHGSNDPNVVYIRNDKRKAEYEVCFDPGMYSVEVLGLEIENNQRVKDLKHSQRKFREE